MDTATAEGRKTRPGHNKWQQRSMSMQQEPCAGAPAAAGSSFLMMQKNLALLKPLEGGQASSSGVPKDPAAGPINIHVTQPTPNHSPNGSLGSLGALTTDPPTAEAIADALESIFPKNQQQQQQSSSSTSDTAPSPALSNKSGVSSGNRCFLSSQMSHF